MDWKRPIEEVNLDFEFETNGEWEYVMLKNDQKKDDDEEAAEEEEVSDDEGGENNQEEALDMPPAWSPKLSVNRDKFIELCPKGEKTIFYKKCKVEFYSDCKQVDGLVKRLTIYQDYKRLITQEVRSYYKFRRDCLILRRRFPYEFKTIEHYEQSKIMNNWKKLIQVDDKYRKIYYYHHRNKDGLIYREEQISNKTLERYKNRPDKLVFRSVTYCANQKGPFDRAEDLFVEDNNLSKELKIKKMA